MERRPIGADNEEDDKSLDSPRTRSPREVLGDWLKDRQHFLEHALHEKEDDEEEDDDSDSPKKRISRTLRGLFRKNVSKENLEETLAPKPEHAVLGSIVEVQESQPEEAEEEEPDLENLDEIEPELPESNADAIEESSHDDEDTMIVTTSSKAARLPSTPPPTLVNGPTGGGGRNLPPIPPATPGGIPGNIPTANVLGGGTGGNFAPGSTTIERQPVIENHHHHRRAALAALVIAERIDHHRNEKRKEQIKKVEKIHEDYKKNMEDRVSRLEQTKPAAEQFLERPAASSTPKIESTPRPTPITAFEAAPAARQPQSIKEVLESRPSIPERPSLADLEHNQPKHEEHLEREDILVAAEKLAARSSENISHEVYDERWHEVKDSNSMDGFGSYHRAAQSQSYQDSGQLFSSSDSVMHQTSAPMVDPSRTAPSQPTEGKKTISGLWVALVVGVIFAIMLIAL